MKIVKATYTDLKACNPEASDAYLHALLDSPNSEILVALSNNREPLFCGGVIEMWPGVAECFMYIPEKEKDKPIRLARVALKVTKQLKEKYHRLQALCTKGEESKMRFIRFCGFVHEGTMTKYTTDKDDMERFALT